MSSSGSESITNSNEMTSNQTISLEALQIILNQTLNTSAIELADDVNIDNDQTSFNQTISVEALQNFINNPPIVSNEPSGEHSENLLERLMSLEQNYFRSVNENMRLKNHVSQLQEDIYKLWDDMYDTQRDLQQLQKYGRRENIEISGIPDSVPDHILEDTVIRILRRIGVYGLSSYEIGGCHRLKKRNKHEPAKVIVRFINRKRAQPMPQQ